MDSRLARHADYGRHPCEPKIIEAREAGVNALTLANEAVAIHNLITDPHSMSAALNIHEIWRMHGIVSADMVGGKFEVRFSE